MPNNIAEYTLLITGAGVDKTNGIDFPLAATLLSEITSFIENDNKGKEIDKKLREILPNLRFKFTGLINQAIENIAVREVTEQNKMIDRIKHAVDQLDDTQELMKKHGNLLVMLFEKLVSVAKNATLDPDIELLIKEVFPKNGDDFLGSESILDISKISLSDTFKAVLKATLHLSLKKENHSIACALGAEMLNIENLLVSKFLGFYNNKPSDIKNYIYISWALWGFLVFSEKKVLEKEYSSLPFYPKIPKNWRAVTLNYTSFLELSLGRDNVIYFHGGLSEYVNMNNRELVSIDSYQNLDIINFLDECVKPNICISDDYNDIQRHVIPALVPPLKLKPVLSSNYIEKWYKASEWVDDAKRIVIIGYSFNSADEHFNDIIRKHGLGKKIFIISPNIDSNITMRNIENIFSIQRASWTKGIKLKFPSWSSREVHLIKAHADEIDLNSL